ncbi:MAG: carboxymuconolactone decarboxylase family protein [Thermodesulfobacteriota bacterium]
MEEKSRLLVCLSASVASNCIPCFQHYHARALESGLCPEDIRETIELADQVKRGASIALASLVSQVIKGAGKEKADHRSGSTPCCG